jgi:hypothetical protein
VILAIKVDLRFMWIALKLFVSRQPLIIPIDFVRDGLQERSMFGATGEDDGPVVH